MWWRYLWRRDVVAVSFEEGYGGGIFGGEMWWRYLWRRDVVTVSLEEGYGDGIFGGGMWGRYLWRRDVGAVSVRLLKEFKAKSSEWYKNQYSYLILS
jgi:hypothetical protein